MDKIETVEDMKELKDVLLAKEQGQALKRATFPIELHETLGLGKFGPETNVVLNSLVLVERLINSIAGERDVPLADFSRGIGTASGSNQATRLEKSLETIAHIGQYIPGLPEYGMRFQPTHLMRPLTDEERKGGK